MLFIGIGLLLGLVCFIGAFLMHDGWLVFMGVAAIISGVISIFPGTCPPLFFALYMALALQLSSSLFPEKSHVSYAQRHCATASATDIAKSSQWASLCKTLKAPVSKGNPLLGVNVLAPNADFEGLKEPFHLQIERAASAVTVVVQSPEARTPQDFKRFTVEVSEKASPELGKPTTLQQAGNLARVRAAAAVLGDAATDRPWSDRYMPN